MITLGDLDEAIKECEGQRNPNANTAIKLAAFYTIRNELYPRAEPSQPGYSFSAPPQAEYTSETEFGTTIRGKETFQVMEIFDDLMSVLRTTQPRLHRRIINQIEDL